MTIGHRPILSESTIIAKNPAAMKAVPRRRFQISLAMLFGLVAVTGLVIFAISPERPPPPIVPAGKDERAAIALARDHFKKSGSTELPVPIEIAPGPDLRSYRIKYWTNRREFEMLGSPTAIVRLDNRTVEWLPRD